MTIFCYVNCNCAISTMTSSGCCLFSVVSTTDKIFVVYAVTNYDC